MGARYTAPPPAGRLGGRTGNSGRWPAMEGGSRALASGPCRYWACANHTKGERYRANFYVYACRSCVASGHGGCCAWQFFSDEASPPMCITRRHRRGNVYPALAEEPIPNSRRPAEVWPSRVKHNRTLVLAAKNAGEVR